MKSDSPERLPEAGHYAVQRTIGRGGMGVVYLARDERLNRNVALKVLSEYDLPGEERRARFVREARSAAAIRHPNVATIYDVGESTDGSPYIAMEFCEGELLSDLIRKQKIDAPAWLLIARQIADGLAAAHRSGIVHRDIKSANIMVEPDGRVKILDFGLAKTLEQEIANDISRASSAGHFFGTVPYMSPEQARGGAADEKSDLFSVGVVLYEMATGRLPFDAESPLALLEQIRTAPPQPIVPLDPSLSQAATMIILRLLEKNPAERFQSADSLRDSLDRMAATADTLRQTIIHSGKVTLPPRRRKWGLIAAAIALPLVLLGGYVFTRYKSSPAPQVSKIRSVAVLPFQNVSGVAGDQFLSIGLADALTTRLQQIPELQVRPTSATLAFDGAPLDARSAAERLDVDGVLEGRYLASGPDVRVNLQLTDSRTGYGVWAGSVNGKRADLLRLIDSVSEETVTALNQKLNDRNTTGASQPRSSHPGAFERYLRARALVGTLRPESAAEQVALLKKAIELDPQFAAAYAELAIALSLGRIRGFDLDATNAEAEWYARQAVRLDPNLAAAHFALGKTLVRSPDRFSESTRETLAALRLNPNDSQALYSLVTYFVSAGDLEKIACVTERFIRVDPSSNDVKARGYWNINAVDPEGAIRVAPVALSSPETRLAGHDILASAYLIRGDLRAAEEQQRQAAELVPDHYIPKSLLAMIQAARGNRKEALAAIETFEDQAKTIHWASLRVALVHAKLGNRTEALQAIETTARLGNHNWYFLVKHPWLEPLQGEPRFRAAVGKIKRDLDDVREDVIGVYELMCREKAGQSAAR